MLESVSVFPVLPFDQLTVPLHPAAVSVSVLGLQTDRLAGGVIVGALGLAFISRAIAVELAEVHPLTVQVAEIE